MNIGALVFNNIISWNSIFTSLLNISSGLILLSSMIYLLAYYKVQPESSIWLLILHLVICLGFITNNLFTFYIFFELMLLPIFYTIYFSGQSQDKTYISYKFMYYTLTGSYLWLIILIFGNNVCNMDNTLDFILGGLFLISLLIKLPLPPFHLWLNDTHTASPVSCSIILAGTALKLSVFGIICYYLPWQIQNFIYITSLLLAWIIIGSIYTCLICIRQSDYKRFVAYTSIGHMLLTLYGIVNLSVITTFGLYVLLLSHAMISCTLFYHVDVIYNKYHTKLMVYFSGLSITMPCSALLIIIFHLYNFGIPPSLAWFCEYFIFSSSIESFSLSAYLVCSIMIISLIYTLFTTFRIYFGNINPYLLYGNDYILKDTNLIVNYGIVAVLSGYILSII